MRSVEDKGSLNSGASAQEISGLSCIGFDFHRRNHAGKFHASQHRPTPSKWDDAQKWLVNLSRGEKNQPKASPRNSSADDRRLISTVAALPDKDEDLAYEDGMDMDSNDGLPEPENVDQYGNEDVETKGVMDCSDDSVWRINKAVNYNSKSVVRSVCVRDMGTEMTPIGSQEPSRTATPIRTAAATATSAATTTPRSQEGHVTPPATSRMADDEPSGERNKTKDESKMLNPLEIRAIAWDEAERAKYMARYKREEVKIQAWENHEKRRAEMEMRSIEAKADRLKYRAQEKYANKVAETRRIAEEKRANAEAELNEKAVKTSESADYIRTTGHLPSSFSFNCCSFCW